MKAINIILDEHRSLAAVLHGMLYLFRKIRNGTTLPDFKLLGAMLYYIDAFPDCFHHPKDSNGSTCGLRRIHSRVNILGKRTGTR